ncbi:hypothetical protein KAI56_00705 [Candidatus Parcubacteria bacterium]|nr:hypothetical protein [Candidatus Parcubacteria bacterium]
MDENIIYNCWKLFFPSVRRNKTLLVVKSIVNIIGRSLCLVIQKALKAEIKNRANNDK